MVKYQIELDNDLWHQFKEIVPKSTTLNDAIVELIKEQVKASEKK